jgi:hypothetical protein
VLVTDGGVGEREPAPSASSLMVTSDAPGEMGEPAA